MYRANLMKKYWLMWDSCRAVTCLERFDVHNQSTRINVTRFRPAQPEDVTLEAALP